MTTYEANDRPSSRSPGRASRGSHRPAVPYLAQPGGEQDDRQQDAERGDRLQPAATERARLELLRQLVRRRLRDGDVHCGRDLPDQSLPARRDSRRATHRIVTGLLAEIGLPPGLVPNGPRSKRVRAQLGPMSAHSLSFRRDLWSDFGSCSRAMSWRSSASSAWMARAPSITWSSWPTGKTTAPDESASTELAGHDPDALQYDRDVRLERRHFPTAPLGRLAGAVGGEVVAGERVKVAQATICQHTRAAVLVESRELGPTSHRDLRIAVAREHHNPPLRIPVDRLVKEVREVVGVGIEPRRASRVIPAVRGARPEEHR